MLLELKHCILKLENRWGRVGQIHIHDLASRPPLWETTTKCPSFVVLAWKSPKWKPKKNCFFFSSVRDGSGTDWLTSGEVFRGHSCSLYKAITFVQCCFPSYFIPKVCLLICTEYLGFRHRERVQCSAPLQSRDGFHLFEMHHQGVGLSAPDFESYQKQSF